MCILVSVVYMTFNIITKGYKGPGNQGAQFLETRVHMTDLIRSVPFAKTHEKYWSDHTIQITEQI